jgi:hypothetical protein
LSNFKIQPNLETKLKGFRGVEFEDEININKTNEIENNDLKTINPRSQVI